MVGYVEEDQEEAGEAAPVEGEPRQAPEHGPLSAVQRASGSMARVELLSVRGDPAAWAAIGLDVAGDGTIGFAGASLRIEATTAHPPMSWSISGTADGAGVDPADIDGLPTELVEPATRSGVEHRLGATGVDHVVVLTPSIERTSAAIAAATGSELRRVREVGSMRQGFHRIGPRPGDRDETPGLIVELVERPEQPAGPAAFWGFVLTVVDLDGAVALLGGDRVSSPKDAVQPGRRIATIRSSAGLGVAVALLSAR
jgi:hypothetical protein